MLTSDQLSQAILEARPKPSEVLCIARWGERFEWSRADGEEMRNAWSGRALPDAWIFYSGSWPVDDGDRWAAFFDDLLAELDSMSGGIDRCRWPLDEPWPHGH